MLKQKPSQTNTTKPVGVHFRSAEHSQADMVVHPIEKVRAKDRFILQDRESFWIKNYQAVKNQAVEVIELGLKVTMSSKAIF